MSPTHVGLLHVASGALILWVVITRVKNEIAAIAGAAVGLIVIIVGIGFLGGVYP